MPKTKLKGIDNIRQWFYEENRKIFRQKSIDIGRSELWSTFQPIISVYFNLAVTYGRIPMVCIQKG